MQSSTRLISAYGAWVFGLSVAVVMLMPSESLAMVVDSSKVAKPNPPQSSSAPAPKPVFGGAIPSMPKASPPAPQSSSPPATKGLLSGSMPPAFKNPVSSSQGSSSSGSSSVIKSGTGAAIKSGTGSTINSTFGSSSSGLFSGGSGVAKGGGGWFGGGSGVAKGGGGWFGGGSGIASMSGSYGYGPIADVLCQVVGWFSGSVGQAISTLAVITLGIGALFGKVSHGMAVTVMVGIATIFGAQDIVGALSGMGSACY